MKTQRRTTREGYVVRFKANGLFYPSDEPDQLDPSQGVSFDKAYVWLDGDLALFDGEELVTVRINALETIEVVE